jgi:hypothetical protein
VDLFESFLALPMASSAADFSAVPLSGPRSDYLAKSSDGGPVFLLHDASPANYSPGVELKHISVQFHSTCRVTFNGRTVEDQFAVLVCDASAPELYEVFVRAVAATAEQLPPETSTVDLQRCLQTLLDLFRALARPSNQEVTGLWAELFVIAYTENVSCALEAWHANQFEKFDFSWVLACLEVKATVKDSRQHEFALEQLRKPSGGAGYVASMLLRPLSGGLGILDLATRIERNLVLHPTLRQKLWTNIASALGSDFSEKLDRRFDGTHVERTLMVYAMDDIPAPETPADPRVTAVRFRADLTALRSTLVGTPRALLNAIFMQR